MKAASVRSISSESPFWFGNLIHVYLELRLKVQDLEGAESVSKAKLALEYIRKAADAADHDDSTLPPSMPPPMTRRRSRIEDLSL